ncbi:MAG: membrane protein insertase YidC [Candidatus Zixiibacteriota bacterium]
MNEEKPMDVKALLAFAILIAIVLLLPKYWDIVGGGGQPTDRTAPDTVAVATTPTESPTQSETTGQKDQFTPPSDEWAAPGAPDTVAGRVFVPDSLWTEETIRIETDLYSAALSTRGAIIEWLILKDYEYTEGPRKGEAVVIVDTIDNAGPRLVSADKAFTIENAPFRADRSSLTLRGNDSNSVTFTTRLRDGSELAITYMFHGNRHDFTMSVSMPRPAEAGIQREYWFGWKGGLRPTEPNPEDDNNNFAAVALMGEDLEKINDVDRDEPVHSFTGITHWAAVRTKYFVCAAIPQGREADGFVVESSERPLRWQDERLALKTFSAYLRHELSAGAPIDQRYLVYVGPLEYSELKSYGLGLEDLIDLGWRWLIRPFSLLVLWLFRQIHHVIPNYGVVIIIFALLVKIIFHPLTKKSMRSMRRMQELQPRMEKLRERFKSDPQKLNQEMMKMYKDAGINPISGCLPLLPQMPIFYALFQVFRTTIELRGAYFVGWITDLSQKDPYYILPIIMTLSFFLQQRLSTKDPKQKMLTYVLPLVFGFMFRNFPAGLTLYWTMYNIFSVIEQVWLIGHPQTLTEDDATEAEVVSSTPPRGRRNRSR